MWRNLCTVELQAAEYDSLFWITIVGLLLTFGGLALHAILIEWNFPLLLSVC